MKSRLKLVLYSGGDYSANVALNVHLVRLAGRARPTAAFIPSSVDHGREDFDAFVDHFDRRHDFADFTYLPVDRAVPAPLLRRALRCDLIFISGGNTFHFLHHLRRQKLLAPLAAYARGGGVLAGLSAGAILMTPTIRTAGFPEFDRDENDAAIRNLRGLGLVGFEFYPHFTRSARYVERLTRYSRGSKHPLFACPDGAGLVVEGVTRADGAPMLTVVGGTRIFHGGRKFTL